MGTLSYSEIVEHLAARRYTPVVLDELQAAAEMQIKVGATLDQCLGGEGTVAKRLKSQRNLYLRKLATLMIDHNLVPVNRSLALAMRSEVHKFVTRGPYREWKKGGRPAAGASDMQVALFYVAHRSNGEVLTARQIANLLGNK